MDGRVALSTPAAAIEAGIVMVPEDRKGQGLNLALRSAEHLAALGTVDGPPQLITSKVPSSPRQGPRGLDIRGSGAAGAPMSGGNQQKVLLGKWLVREPRVFIVDEPTRGVDVGAKMAIYEIIREFAADGVAVIVVSSELEEVLGLSHRVLVMSGGRQQGVLTRAEATPRPSCASPSRSAKS